MLTTAQKVAQEALRIDVRPDDAEAILWLNDIEKDDKYQHFKKNRTW